MKHKLLHPSATFVKKTSGSVGFDLTATQVKEIGEIIEVHYGVTVSIPKQCVGLLVPRSSTFEKFRIMQTNGVGIIDPDYTGELIAKFIRVGRSVLRTPKVGDCIGQLVVIKDSQLKTPPALKSEAKRTGGFGSTDASPTNQEDTDKPNVKATNTTYYTDNSYSTRRPSRPTKKAKPSLESDQIPTTP